MASQAKKDFFKHLYETSDSEDEIPVQDAILRKPERLPTQMPPSPRVVLKFERQALRDSDTKSAPRRGKMGNDVVRIFPRDPHKMWYWDKNLLEKKQREAKQRREKQQKQQRNSFKGKSLLEAPEAKAPKQIFEGKRFYFFQENHIGYGRIDACKVHGGVWVKEWTDDDPIDYIIVDICFTYEDVLKYFGIEALPSNVFLVNRLWTCESIRCGFMVREGQRHYRVEGYPYSPSMGSPIIHKEAASMGQLATKRSAEAMTSPHSPQSRTSKRLKTKSNRQGIEISPPVPRKDDSSETFKMNLQRNLPVDWRGSGRIALGRDFPESNTLDEAIKEAKVTADLPFDDDSDEGDCMLLGGKINGESKPEAGNEVLWGNSSKIKSKSWQDNFACMKENDSRTADRSPNAHTIEILQRMAAYYDRSRDHWRTNGYGKAISTLQRQTQLIATREEALSLPSIGEHLAEKIEKIVQTKSLRCLQKTTNDPLEIPRQQFMSIYGVGLKHANMWIASGWRTLEDLQANAKLSRNQRIGLDHYEDFQRRIPRQEIERHEAVVKTALSEMLPHLKATIGGSYRRGAPDSGDVDFLVTAPGLSAGTLSHLVFQKLIPRLLEMNYLMCSLTNSKEGCSSKWLGAAQLPGTTLPWRRVDILVVPEAELGAALIYWTGNDIFNRSMRLLARKKGMRLNQRGLFKDVLRGQNKEKVTTGTLVEGRNERRIFAALGVPWRPPEHRNC